MNILYVGNLPPIPGGEATVNAQLLSAFSELGHHVCALSPRTRHCPNDRDPFAEKHPKLCVTRYSFQHFTTVRETVTVAQLRDYNGTQITNALPRLIDAEQPDLLLIGGEGAAWHCPGVAQESSLPCVLCMHGGVVLRKMVAGAFPPAEMKRLLERYRQIDRLVAVAEHFALDLQQLDLNGIRVIPNPVDTRRFYPQGKDTAVLEKLEISREETVVLFLANLKDVKRPLDLVYSAADCLKKNSKLVYLVVGDGELRRRMEEACRERGIAGSFRFVGWVEHEEVPLYINAADMVVMTSEVEVQSLVYLETQACGRLLLASDIPASREVVVHGENGLLFRMGDVGDLVEKTLWAAASVAECEVIGQKALQSARKNHSLEIVAGKYLKVFGEVGSPRPTGSNGYASSVR